jgi:hypothetical protein
MAQSSPVSIPPQTRYPRHVSASPLLAGNHKTGTNFTVCQWLVASTRLVVAYLKKFADLTSKLTASVTTIQSMKFPCIGKCSCFVAKQSNPSVYITALMLEEAASKMSIHFYQITRCHTPGGSNMHSIILKGQHHAAQSLIS